MFVLCVSGGRCFGARWIMCSRVAGPSCSGMAAVPALMRLPLSGRRRVGCRAASGALTGRAGVLLPVRCGRAPCSRLLLRLVAAGWWLSPAGAARLPPLRLPAPWVSVSGCAGECPRRCPTGVLRLPCYRLPCSATAHRIEREARPIQCADYHNPHNPTQNFLQKRLDYTKYNLYNSKCKHRDSLTSGYIPARGYHIQLNQLNNKKP